MLFLKKHLVIKFQSKGALPLWILNVYMQYKLEDVRAVFYDLNSDGISEVIGYINAPSSWCREGMALFILQKVNNSYNDNLGYFNFYPEKGIRILNTKTDGYYDFEITEDTTVLDVIGETKVFRLVFEN